MEMCIDNPREGFGELFDTHPTVESRVAALVKFAGGHDPGPLALPPAPSDVTDDQPGLAEPSPDASAGPWGPETAPNDSFRHPGSVVGAATGGSGAAKLRVLRPNRRPDPGIRTAAIRRSAGNINLNKLQISAKPPSLALGQPMRLPKGRAAV